MGPVSFALFSQITGASASFSKVLQAITFLYSLLHGRLLPMWRSEANVKSGALGTTLDMIC
jgi:hypothetical protein